MSKPSIRINLEGNEKFFTPNSFSTILEVCNEGLQRAGIFYAFKGQLQRFDKLSLFDRFRHVENGFDIIF